MAKLEKVTSVEETAVSPDTLRTQENPVTAQPVHRVVDNRGLIFGVAGAVVLFIVGIILGYLWGNSNTGYTSRSTMLNGQHRTFDRDDMPMFQQRTQSSTNGTTNQQSTSSSNATGTTQQQ